jgi:RNA polymerase sigma-70 factor, ECF subfamily
LWTPDHPDEEQRLLLAAKHNIDAFKPLYERYAPRLYGYLRRRVATAEEAEDLTSQTFIRAISALDSYRGGLVGAWLFNIALNLLTDHFRKVTPPIAPFDEALAIPSDSPSPLDEVIRLEERQRLEALIAGLTDSDKELLRLRLHGELEAEAIGALTGRTAGAVRTALHRIIQRLANKYRELENANERN